MKAATAADREGLMTLWNQCFDADERYSRLAFGGRYPLGNTWILEEENKLACAVSLLPCAWEKGGEQYRGFYLYGLGTLPEYRGKGYATKLTEQVLAHLKEKEAAFAVLMPAEPGLFDFYRRQGFTECAGLSTVDVEEDEKHALAAEAPQLRKKGFCLLPVIAGDRYAAVRHELLKNAPEGVFCWEDKHYSYADREAAYYGGHLFFLCRDGKPVGCAGCWPWQDTLTVKELLLPEQYRHEGLSLLAEIAGKRSLTLRLPPWEQGKAVPWGMVKWLTEDHPQMGRSYLGLTLD